MSKIIKEPMRHKIAIVKSRLAMDYDDGRYSYDKKIIDSITDWEEVDHETFSELTRAGGRLDFSVIERPINITSFIPKSIADYRQLVKQDEAKLAAIKAEREKKALERKHKKELKDKESKKKLFEQLKKELAEEE